MSVSHYNIVFYSNFLVLAGWECSVSNSNNIGNNINNFSLLVYNVQSVLVSSLGLVSHLMS